MGIDYGEFDVEAFNDSASNFLSWKLYRIFMLVRLMLSNRILILIARNVSSSIFVSPPQNFLSTVASAIEAN